jgi:hypothetical protein
MSILCNVTRDVINSGIGQTGEVVTESYAIQPQIVQKMVKFFTYGWKETSFVFMVNPKSRKVLAIVKRGGVYEAIELSQGRAVVVGKYNDVGSIENVVTKYRTTGMVVVTKLPDFKVALRLIGAYVSALLLVVGTGFAAYSLLAAFASFAVATGAALPVVLASVLASISATSDAVADNVVGFGRGVVTGIAGDYREIDDAPVNGYTIGGSMVNAIGRGIAYGASATISGIGDILSAIGEYAVKLLKDLWNFMQRAVLYFLESQGFDPTGELDRVSSKFPYLRPQHSFDLF